MRKKDFLANGLWVGTIFPVPATGLIAAGSSTTDALVLSGLTDNYILATVAASTGARLVPGDVGDEVCVTNYGANTLTLYPPSGGKANNGSTDVGVSVAAGKTAFVKFTTATTVAVAVGA